MQLNHVNITTSYSATLHLVADISKFNQGRLQQWIAKGIEFKFVGDNIDKKRGVRDIRSDHHGAMTHMFSMLAVQTRVASPVGTSVPTQG